MDVHSARRFALREALVLSARQTTYRVYAPDPGVRGPPRHRSSAHACWAFRPSHDRASCGGSLTRWQALGTGRFERVEGWLNASDLEFGSLVLILDSRDTIVGFALSRARSLLRPRAEGPGATVFTGYAHGHATTDSHDLRACVPSKAA